MSAADRFLDLATRPLADNAELLMAARASLAERIEEHAVAPGALAQAADALERADRRPRRRWWRCGLLAAALLVFLPSLGIALWHYLGFGRLVGFYSPLPPAATSFQKRTNRHFEALAPEQRLLLLGDRGAADEALRWKPLHDSAPDNPAYLAAYAAACFRDKKEIPPEVLDTAARVDPDNGWYLAMAAAGRAKGAMRDIPVTPAEKKAGKRASWQVSDNRGARDALDLLHRAAQKPVMDSREAELLRQRILLLPPRRDVASQLPAIAYLAGQDFSSLSYRVLGQFCGATARQCGERGDVEGFKRIVADWEWLVRQATANGWSLIDQLIARATMQAPLPAFAETAQALGLAGDARRFADLDRQLAADTEARKERRRNDPLSDLARDRGSMLAALTLPAATGIVESPPTPTEQDLRPARLADHALADRLAAAGSWLTLGLCAAGVAVQRFRHSPLTLALASRMTGLLRPSDHAWILLGGIVAPWLWHLGIARLSPWSAREWSVPCMGGIPFAGQLAARLALWLLVPVAIARWRLGMRGAVVGFAVPRPWIAWLAVAAAAASLPVFGAVTPEAPAAKALLVLGGVLLGSSLLWLAVAAGRGLFSAPCHALRHATTARWLVKAWLFGMLTLALAMPLHYLEERHWIQQDRLLEITADPPAISRHESQLTEALRRDLLEKLDRGGR